MSAEDYKSDDVLKEQEDQNSTEKKNYDVEMEVANDGNDFQSDEYGDECYEVDDYDFEMDDDLYEEIDFNLLYEYGSEEEEAWRYPWRKSSEPPNKKLLEIENMLNIWKPLKERLLEEYREEEKFLNNARKILADIESIEINCLSVLQRLHLIHDNVLHEVGKAQAKAELEIDKIGNDKHEINVQLKSLKLACFILRTQIQVFTKTTTFNQIKEIEKLMKMAKETEKGASDSVNLKNKEIAHAERVVFELESDKAKMLKQVDELSDATEIQEDHVIEVNDITT